MFPFADRAAAGRALAQYLEKYRDQRDILVLALPRGGVPVGFEVARCLHAPLDVMIVRKLGAPHQPEFALGAIASGGVTVVNQDALRWFQDSPALDATVAAARVELARRESLYRAGRPALSARNKTVIVVDDGAATGTSMLAAVRAVRQLKARKIVVALPVASLDALTMLQEEADEVVCMHAPPAFTSVGFWYQDFEQTSDEQVIELLAPLTSATSEAARQ
jgi:putative phosphoribosyl transferase